MLAIPSFESLPGPYLIGLPCRFAPEGLAGRAFSHAAHGLWRLWGLSRSRQGLIEPLKMA